MNNTKLLYFDDSYQFESDATVQDIITTDDGRTILILDRTIFYPQGGGQPYDTGRIESTNAQFDVKEVRFVDGFVHHIGDYIKGILKVGESARLSIDEDRRRKHAKLHSGGHLLDIAMREAGYDLKAVKGHHFPDGAYVEFAGEVPLNEREQLIGKIQEQSNKLIMTGYAVSSKLIEKDKLAEYCLIVPDYIPDNKPSRVVTIYGDLGHPYGGTHVQNINEIGSLTITKVKNKDGNTRISYAVG